MNSFQTNFNIKMGEVVKKCYKFEIVKKLSEFCFRKITQNVEINGKIVLK